MKQTLFGAALLSLSTLFFASCSHDTTEAAPAPNNNNNSGSSALYYTDSAKIYRVGMNGSDRTLIAGIDTTSPNSYIGSAVRSIDGSKIFFLHHLSGASQSIKMYSVGTDGTGLAMLKTMPTGGNEYRLMNATADNKIVFYQVAVLGGAINTSIQTIGTDGNGQAQLASIPPSSPLLSRLASNNRWAGISFGGTMMVKTGMISAGALGTASDVASPLGSGAYAISSDGSKIAYAVINGAAIDVKVYDVASNNTTTAFSHTIVSDIGTFASYTAGVRWVAGTEKLLLFYGKFTSPSGSASDFTQVQIHTISNNTDASWRIFGDQTSNIIAE